MTGKEYFESLKSLALKEAASSIYMSMTGFATMIFIVIDPDSKLGKGATAFLDNLASGYKLATVFTLIVSLFLLFASLFRLIELPQKTPAVCSTWLSKTGVNGFASFVAPLAALSFSMGIVCFATLLWGAEGSVKALKITKEIVFGLTIFVPLALTALLVFFHSMSELLQQESKEQTLVAIFMSGAFLVLSFVEFFQLLK